MKPARTIQSQYLHDNNSYSKHMRTPTKHKLKLSLRTPKPVRAIRKIALVTAAIGTLCYPLSFITQKMIYPHNRAGVQVDFETLIVIEQVIPRVGSFVIALSILLAGIAERINYHHSHRNDDKTSKPKLIAVTVTISILWLLLSITSKYLSAFTYAFIYGAIW